MVVQNSIVKYLGKQQSVSSRLLRHGITKSTAINLFIWKEDRVKRNPIIRVFSEESCHLYEGHVLLKYKITKVPCTYKVRLCYESNN